MTIAQLKEGLHINWSTDDLDILTLVTNACQHQSVLRIEGATPIAKPMYSRLLLREAAIRYARKVETYLTQAYGTEYQSGVDLKLGSVSYRDHGTLSGVPVEIFIDSIQDLERPPAAAVLQAILKFSRRRRTDGLIIAMDTNSQKWNAWRIRFGDCGWASEFEDTVVQAAMGNAPGTANQTICSSCPYRQVCQADRARDYPAYLKFALTVPFDGAGDILDPMDVLLAKPQHRPPLPRISPSHYTTESCDRALGYSLLGTEEIRTNPAKTVRVFDFGHCIHDVMQSALLRVNPEIEIEKRGSVRDLEIVAGTADAVVPDAVYEMKSINEREWQSMTKEKKPHAHQANLYAKMHEKDIRLFLYTNKATGEVKAFKSAFDVALWDFDAQKISNLKAQVDAGELPPRLEGDAARSCPNCKYYHACKTSATFKRRS